ncbi:MAG: Gfo/Idh/MocA family oxidoreductase [Candidatus Hydrogenedentes bacterium]|nr:Gfo/Idh/MocA family oxidoreductase [Candidatus Hydrogenedentota bacterium]
MIKKIRWGILGTGSIAHQFARGLRAAEGAELSAVGSRAAKTAEAFGNEFDIPRRHATYEALASDPEVDAIYVATPHPMHKECTLLSLNHGKAVLCEKPFAVNVREAAEMVKTARDKKLFLMEAMWTRFIPVVVKAREWVRQGKIGEVRMLQSDFGFRAGWDETSRLLDPKFAGGALLDVGIYPIALAYFFLGGGPQRIVSTATLGDTGVDEQNAIVFEYASGALALLSSAVRTNTQQEAFILGTEGNIKLHAPFWKATKATLTVDGKGEETCEIPHKGNGYEYEAEEVMQCMRAGRLESPVIPLDETLAMMETMDAIRAQWGMKYPFE